MEINFSEETQNALDHVAINLHQEYVENAVRRQLREDGYLSGISWSTGGSHPTPPGGGGVHDSRGQVVPRVEQDGDTWTFHAWTSGAGGGRVGAKISMQEIAEANNGMPVAPFPDAHIYGAGGGYYHNGQIWRAGGGHPDNPPAVGIGEVKA